MQKELKEQEIYDAIKSGFANFKILAKASLMRRWAKMPLKTRMNAGRSLVYINGVAQNPALYFSRKNTEDAWSLRADDWVLTNNTKPNGKMYAYYIVQSPMDLVVKASQDAFYGDYDLRHHYYNFCRTVQNWEYDRTSPRQTYVLNAGKFAEQIVADARRVQAMVDILRSNALVRPLKKLVYSFQR